MQGGELGRAARCSSSGPRRRGSRRPFRRSLRSAGRKCQLRLAPSPARPRHRLDHLRLDLAPDQLARRALDHDAAASMMARRWQRRSASSMKWVVSRMVLPSAVRRLRRSRSGGGPAVEPGGRLVEDQQIGVVQPARAQASGAASCRPTACGCWRPPCRQPRELEQLRDAGADRRVLDAEVAAIDQQVLGAGEVGSRLSNCGTRRRGRGPRARSGTGSPARVMAPAPGAVRPRQQRSVVVLPAPLGPSRP